MQNFVTKDPYQLVCKAFELNELQELLLGENNYGYKMDFRNDWTSSEEKTDLIIIYRELVKYYFANNENPIISHKITDILMNITPTSWGVDVVTSIINSEVQRRTTLKPHLNLDLDKLINHLRSVIQNNRAALMQEKQYGGRSFDKGMYGYLENCSALHVREGFPSYIVDNSNAKDHFESETTFTLILPNKFAILRNELLNTFMQRAEVTLKGTPIPNGNGFIPAPDSTWTYTMKKEKFPTGEIQLICMINNLYRGRTKILKAIDEFKLKSHLKTIIWLESSNQQINIPSKTLQIISEMSIPFDIEIRLMDSNSTT